MRKVHNSKISGGKVSDRSMLSTGPQPARDLLGDCTDVVPNPVPIRMVELEVKVNPETLFRDYVIAFVQECENRHPERVDKVALAEEELFEYCRYLLSQRVAIVRHTVKAPGRLRDLFIPDFIQLCLESVGEVVSMELNVTILPKQTECKLDFDGAFQVSNKLYRWADLMRVRKDAMPRGSDGDVEVMSSILAEDHVWSMKDVHPTSVVVAAFLGLTVKKEIMVSSLWKAEYRNASAIRRAFLQREGLL